MLLLATRWVQRGELQNLSSRILAGFIYLEARVALTKITLNIHDLRKRTMADAK